MHSMKGVRPASCCTSRLTSNMFLLWRSLFWTGSFLDVHDQLLFSLVLVDGPSGIVNFLIDVKASPRSATEPSECSVRDRCNQSRAYILDYRSWGHAVSNGEMVSECRSNPCLPSVHPSTPHSAPSGSAVSLNINLVMRASYS